MKKLEVIFTTEGRQPRERVVPSLTTQKDDRITDEVAKDVVDKLNGDKELIVSCPRELVPGVIVIEVRSHVSDEHLEKSRDFVRDEADQVLEKAGVVARLR